MDTIVSIVVAFVGIALGATLQFIFSRASESKKSLEELRSQAYLDYLQSIADAATARTNELLISANSKAVYAKARICIVGSRKVIEALVVQNKDLAIVSTEAMTRLAALCEAMRDDIIGARGSVGIDNIRSILFRTNE